MDKDIGPFIEFVEINRKLGVDTIFIYGAHNVSESVMNVIQYYVLQGAVILVPWKVPMKVEYADKFYDINAMGSNIPGLCCMLTLYIYCIYYKYITYVRGRSRKSQKGGR